MLLDRSSGLGVGNWHRPAKIRRDRVVYVLKAVVIGWDAFQQVGLNHVDWKRCRSFKIK